VIIKKYVGGDDYERERRSSPFIIGAAIVSVIILIFVIGIWIKYFHHSRDTEETPKTENPTSSSDSITPAGEKILAELQQKIIELNKENYKLKTEISNLKNQKEKLHSSMTHYSSQLKSAREEKKDLIQSKASQSASVKELQDALNRKQQELVSSQSELIKKSDEARQCKNQYNEMYNKLQTVSQGNDDTLNRLLEQLKKTNKDLNNMKEKNAQLEQKMKTLQTQINQLTNPNPPTP